MSCINQTSKPTNTFLLRYYTQESVEGFAVVSISKSSIEIIKLMRLLLTLGKGNNINLHSIQSYCDDKCYFFIPRLGNDYFINASEFDEQLKENKVFHWKIERIKKPDTQHLLIVEVLFIESYHDGISLVVCPYPNEYTSGGRIFTAKIPYSEIGL